MRSLKYDEIVTDAESLNSEIYDGNTRIIDVRRENEYKKNHIINSVSRKFISVVVRTNDQHRIIEPLKRFQKIMGDVKFYYVPNNHHYLFCQHQLQYCLFEPHLPIVYNPLQI